MKRLGVLLLCLCFGLQASKNQELFLQANNAYLKHDLDHALALYEQIVSKGPAVWFNMAHVYYQKEDYLNALIHYKKAKQGAMLQTLQDIEKQVAQTQKKLQVVEQKGWFEKFTNSAFELVGLLPLLPLQLLCLLSAFLLAISIMLWKKRHQYVLFGIIFLSSSILLYLKYLSMHRISGVATAQTDVFVGPRKEFHSVAKLTPGTSILIKKRSDDWYQIRGTGLSGWVSADTITLL